MTNKSTGFIGGGRVTRIFLEGRKRAHATPGKIVVSDSNTGTLDQLKARFPNIETASANGLAASQDIVFLAVHPAAMTDAATNIKAIYWTRLPALFQKIKP